MSHVVPRLVSNNLLSAPMAVLEASSRIVRSARINSADAVIPLAFATIVVTSIGFAMNWMFTLAAAVAVGLLILATLSPLAFLALYLAEILLVPVTAGFVLSPELPVMFLSRPLLVIGIGGVILQRACRRGSYRLRNPLLLPLLIFLLGAAASIPGSVDTRLSLFKFLSLLFEWAGVAFVAWSAISSRRDCLRLLNWIVLVFIGVSILGLVEAFTGFNLNQVLATGYTPQSLFYETLSRGSLSRVRSTFPHPIELGGTLAFIFPVAFTLLINAKKRSAQLFYGFMAASVLANIGLSLSLGPIIGLLVAMMGILALRQGRRLVTAALLIGFPLLMVGFQTDAGQQVVQELVIDRFDSGSEGFTSMAGRVAILLAAEDAFSRYPIFGSGLSTWFVVNPYAYFMGVGSSNGIGGNENFYAQVLVETGAVGITTLFTALAVILFQLRQRIASSTSERDRSLVVGVFSALLGFLVLNVTANVFQAGGGQPAATVWTVLICCLRHVPVARSDIPSAAKFGEPVLIS